MKVSVRKLAVLVALLACAVVALPATAAAGDRHSKFDKVLQEALAHPPEKARVIIQTRPGARDTLKRTLRGHGDTVEGEYGELDAFTATVHGEDLEALAADPSVLHVSIDAWVTSFGGRSPRPGPAHTDALRSTLGITTTQYTGSGIRVAIVDSGIDPGRDLSGNIAGFWDFTRGSTDPDGMATKAYDDYGHGTFVAGLIASKGRESGQQLMGIAPNTTLYGFKVLDKNGRGRVSDTVAAILSIVREKAEGSRHVDIINLSLGHPVFEPAATDPLVQAVEFAVRHGIIVVTAAGNVGLDANGNAGYAGTTSPGNAPSAITVGAVDTQGTAMHSDDRVAYFSSRGPTWFDAFAKPDVVAPGVALVSNAPRYAALYATYPQLRATASNGNTNFGTLSGTSMAAAVATGVISLALDANTPLNIPYTKTLTPNAMKAVLEYTALTVLDADGVPYDGLTQGTGEINAPGAIAMAAAINPHVRTGAIWANPLQPTTTIGGETLAWSQALIWDENIVWGTNVVWFNSLLWDENIVWGTSENVVSGTSTENIVWGTNIVWANNIVWGNRVVGMMTTDTDGTQNIVWGTSDGLTEENIVWGTSVDGENIVWGTFADGSFSWGSSDGAGENIVWGTSVEADPSGENIVWGTNQGGGEGENIVWGTRRRR